jgi:hypothetical protein
VGREAMTRMIRTMIKTRGIRGSETGVAPVRRARMPKAGSWSGDYAGVRTPSIGKKGAKGIWCRENS